MGKLVAWLFLVSIALFFFFNVGGFKFDPPADPPPKVEGILYFRYFSLD